jgi:hypothetical protein
MAEALVALSVARAKVGQIDAALATVDRIAPDTDWRGIRRGRAMDQDRGSGFVPLLPRLPSHTAGRVAAPHVVPGPLGEDVIVAGEKPTNRKRPSESARSVRTQRKARGSAAWSDSPRCKARVHSSSTYGVAG